MWCLAAPLSRCPCKGTAPIAPIGAVSQRSSTFSNRISKPGSRHTIRCCLLHVIEIGQGNTDEISQDYSRPFCNWSIRESNRQPPTLQVGEITKSSPRRAHCYSWWHKCRSSKYYYMEFSKTLPYTCSTWLSISRELSSDLYSTYVCRF